jgi:glycosyltransferase involved in cell wall biosynthesis
MPVPPWADDLWQRLPMVPRNWTVLSGLRARGALAEAARREPLDALYFHTQVPGLLCSDLIRRTPTALSLDATPAGMDSLGTGYGHATGPGWAEGLKAALNRQMFRWSRRLIALSDWVRRSLIADYGVTSRKISVIPAGADLSLWRAGRSLPRGPAGSLRVLFVGADFARKGGQLLLDVVRRANAEAGRARWELDVVTKYPVSGGPAPDWLRVHLGVRANTPELRALFTAADVFVLPTAGDFSPFVLLEAMAAGLPAVSTRVGAIPEIIDHGRTGLVIDPGDAAGLSAALRTLADSPSLRDDLGRSARLRAERHFDAARNYRELLETLKEVAAVT